MSSSARPPSKGVRYTPENLASIYADNSVAVASMAAAAGPKPKVTKERVKVAWRKLIEIIDKLDTFTNSQQTQLAKNLNKGAVLLQKLITKAIGKNTNKSEKINDGLTIHLMMFDPTASNINEGVKALVTEFLAKEEKDWNIKDKPDRDLFRNMLVKLTATIDGGRRRSKKQKKQRRRTRRQK